MTDELRNWLTQELERRNLSQRRFAKLSGISQGLLWQVITGDVPPSADFCVKAALALGEPPEKLLRLAGILPALPESDDTLAELRDLVENLSPNQRKEALRYLKFLYQNEGTN